MIKICKRCKKEREYFALGLCEICYHIRKNRIYQGKYKRKRDYTKKDKKRIVTYQSALYELRRRHKKEFSKIYHKL